MANVETPTQGENMNSDFEHAQRIIKSQSESIENLIKTVNVYIEISDMRQNTIEILRAENNRCANAMEEVYELREKVHSYKDSINSLSAPADKFESDLVKSEKDKKDLLTQNKVLNNLIEMLNNTIEAIKYEQKFDLERSAKEISSLKSLNTKYKETIADLDNRLGLKYPTIV